MKSEFIEEYSFGEIVIEGERYTDDLILLGEKVKPGWWRERGHRVQKGDLKEILKYEPEIIIIGTGSSGRVSVPKNLSKKIEQKLEHYPTHKACERYNELTKSGKKIAGGFHLTC